MKKRGLLHFAAGVGVGAVVGFTLRNLESTEYNSGYQPKTEVFDEKDYFTDEAIKQHQEDKAVRKGLVTSATEAKPKEEVTECTCEEVADDVTPAFNELKEVVEDTEEVKPREDC